MTGFHDVRLPEDISYGSSGGPEFSTTVVTAQSGFEQRNVNWQQARARYNIAYGVRSDSQLQELLAFFRARQGKAYAFRYKDWNDYQAVNMLLGVGDGVRTTFQLLKTYTSGSTTITRTISKPVAGSVRVYLLDVEVLSGWTVNEATGLLTFASPPAGGVTVKASFDFDVPVRFDTDYLPVTLSDYGVAAVRELSCVEVR